MEVNFRTVNVVMERIGHCVFQLLLKPTGKQQHSLRSSIRRIYYFQNNTNDHHKKGLSCFYLTTASPDCQTRIQKQNLAYKSVWLTLSARFSLSHVQIYVTKNTGTAAQIAKFKDIICFPFCAVLSLFMQTKHISPTIIKRITIIYSFVNHFNL